MTVRPKNLPLKAIESWKKSLESAERYRMPYEQAIAHVLLALYGPESAQELHQLRAAALFARVGARTAEAPSSAGRAAGR